MRAFPLEAGGGDPAEEDHATSQAPGGLPEALLEVTTALNRGLGRQEVFGRIAIQLRRLVPFTSLTIGRADPEARGDRAIRQQLDLLRNEEGIEAELDCDLDRRLDPMVETVVFRALQEALHNVRKHAHASRVRVEVHAGLDALVTAVLADDGIGFDMDEVLPQALAGGHLGLHSLLERVDLAGGSIDLDSRPGAGTRVTVSVPVTLGGGPG